MKVIVYFRQAGGIAAKDYPIITHWTEDENEIPVPVFSAFDLEKMDALPPEILAQMDTVNPWLEARRGVVVATFTEIEDGSSRRPAYGAARKEAARRRAEVLVATGEAIVGLEFAPAPQDGVGVVVLQDPEHGQRSRERWALTDKAVVYFRTPAHRNGTDDGLLKQRREVQKMARSLRIVAEFTEKETAASFERPQLVKALELCREHKAFLLIGTTDAFGSDGEFKPDFTDVPYEVAYRRDYDWPDLTPLDYCPYPIALLIGKQWVCGNLPLYLANSTGTDFLDVQVISWGSAFIGGEIVETTPGSKSLGPIPKDHARLIEAYDVYFDGDFLTEYRIDARLADGTRFIGRAIVKDIPASRWVKVEIQQPYATEHPR